MLDVSINVSWPQIIDPEVMASKGSAAAALAAVVLLSIAKDEDCIGMKFAPYLVVQKVLELVP